MLLSIVVATGVGSTSASAVERGAGWAVQVVNAPTVFAPAENTYCADGARIERCDHFTLIAANIGTAASGEPVVVKDMLPPDTHVVGTPGGEGWTCAVEENAASETVVCQSAEPVPALRQAPGINISLTITTTNIESEKNRVEVTSSDTQPVTAEQSVSFNGRTPSFGPVAFTSEFVGADGVIDSEAGSRPSAFYMTLAVPTTFQSAAPGVPPAPAPLEDIKQIAVAVPAGVVGDARATPTCPLADAVNLKESQTQCPSASKIGRVAIVENEAAEVILFNVTPQPGYAAEFAAYLPALGHSLFLFAKLVGRGPKARVEAVSAPQTSVVPFSALSLIIFGQPGVVDESGFVEPPFFTAPSDCADSTPSELYVDSWQNPAQTGEQNSPVLSDPNWKRASSQAPGVKGCEDLSFRATLELAPESLHSQADEPAGYQASIAFPQAGGSSGRAAPPVKRTVVMLPASVAISPAVASGLVGCAEGPEGIGLSGEAEAERAGRCPGASKIGRVRAITPLLEGELEGGVYVAQPNCSPCSEAQAESGEAFAIYLELANRARGVYIKLKGDVEVGGEGREGGKHNDLAPGQVRTTFAETPQQSVGELKLSLDGGPRAPLSNPQTCGEATGSAELESWAHTPAPREKEGTPNVVLHPSFAIGGCENRFSPSFGAGPVNAQAGAYSPFTMTVGRADREQDLAGVEVHLPEGLIGKLAGFARCGEAEVRAAESDAGGCPAASRVGTATAAAGSGTEPFWQSGNVYLTGPYEGAPFGLAVVVPAVAGPYDLGNIVVRAKITIDPNTAQVTVKSDPLPQMIDGVSLRIKTINVTVGQGDDFTLNPTNCLPASVTGTITSAQGASANGSTPVEAVNCARLAFKPAFTASTAGKTSRLNGASLGVKLVAKPGEANVAKVDVQLPKALPSRLSTLRQACTQVQFESNPAGCPVGSDVGTVTVHTPLLNAPLSGPAYFVSHGGAAFPDLDLVLQGEGVTIDLVGHTDIKKGITYSRFETVPDAPFSSFELNAPQGPNSILAANTNLCATTKAKRVKRRVTVRRGGRTRKLTRTVTVRVPAALTMPTTITAQNGAVVKQSTAIRVTGCTKARKTGGRAKKK